MCAGARRGFGQGAGFGRGSRRGADFGLRGATDPKSALEQQASFLERQLGRIKQQLTRMAGEGPAAQ
jgi:hypothetical protein